MSTLPETSSQTCIFIDAALPDLATLRAGLPHDAEVHLLDPSRNGLQQIAATLVDRHGIPALHLITHGAPGKLFLGSAVIGCDGLGDHLEELHTIASALVEDGELLIYGCEVAAGREGRLFVEALTEMTGLKVAAATHKVGHNTLGGDWTLDVQVSTPGTQVLKVTEWRGVLMPTAPEDGVYLFAEAEDNGDGTYTTADGFFLIRGNSGEVPGGVDPNVDDAVYADVGGASVLGTGDPAENTFTSYIEVTPAATGSFILNSASLGEFYSAPNASATQGPYTNFKNIYVVGLANGIKLAETNKINSGINTYDTSYSGFDFSSFAGKQIDTVRVYFDASIGDMQDRLTLYSLDISGASTASAPEVPVVHFSYDANGTNSVNGIAQETNLGNMVAVDNAEIYFGGRVDDGAYTQVYEIGGSSGVSASSGALEYFSLNTYDSKSFFLRQFKVYNDSVSDITLTITGHNSHELHDGGLASNPAQKTTTAVAKAGVWTTVDLSGDFGEYVGYRLDSGAGSSTVPLYFNDFAIDVTPPPPPPPVVIDLNGTDDGNDFSATLTGSPVALADSDADISGTSEIAFYVDLSQIKAGDKLIFGDIASGGVEIDLDGITGNLEDGPTTASFGTTEIAAFNDRTLDPMFGEGDYVLIQVIGQDAATIAQLLKTDMKFSGSVAGDRAFHFLNDQFQPAATATVTVGAGGGETATPYISGKEKIVINENDNGELAISGFTLGNANDSDDTTTELTVSITAAHGTLRLTETGGITYAMPNDGTDTTIEFSGTIANLRTAINSLRYDPVDNNTTDDPLEIKISADDGTTWQPYTVDVPGKFYYAPNGHYYEYVSADGITWDDAKAAAEAKTLYGLNGYLATVTSQAENDYITPRLGGNGWMGASDAGTEGTWKWVTGPEAGTSFYQGYAEADTNGPVDEGYAPDLNVGAIGGAYENWADGEPNNWERNEDYAHFYSEGGNWNDFAANNWDIAGYIIEYGGSGFGTLQGANLTIATNLKPVLSGVVTGPIAAGTETDLQATPLRLDTDVTLVEDNHTLNWNGEISNYEKVAGRVDVYFIDNEGYNIGLYGSNKISIVSNGDITVDSDGDISYLGNYIGQVTGGDNGNFRVVFDTSAPVSATAVEKVIESITYTVDDAPIGATKLRYVVTDNTGLSSDPVDLVVNVTAENDAPVLSTSTGLLRSNVTPDVEEQAYSVATLANGSIIVAGAVYGDSDLVKLAKYDANGVLDTTFGEDGVATINLENGFDEPSIAIDSNGKIVVAGYSDGQIAVVRYTSLGVLDTTFATEATSHVAYISGDDAYIYSPKVAVLADNSIAVSYGYELETYDEETGSETFVADFAVAKLTTAGALDPAFGTGGIKLVDIASGSGDEAADLLISNGNIVVTGVANVYDADTDDESDFVALAILNGTTGAEIQKTTTGVINDDPWSAFDFDVEGTAIGKQSDGKVIVAGTADEDGLILARYNSNGTLDTTFGTNGKAAFDIFDEAQDIAIDSNNKILVLNDGDLEVVRIKADGSALDDTFGDAGVATITGALSPWGSQIKIAANGTVWIVGGDGTGDDYAFNIAKLSADGVPDENYSSKATYTTLGDPVVLDASISVSDGELSDNQNQSGFAGATLTLARQTTANANDVFSAVEGSDLSFDGVNVVYNGTTVGTFTQVGGTLNITFNSSANEDSVNGVMRNIAYENSDESITEATTVNLVWTFSDGNTGAEGTVAQGSGGAKSTTLVQTVHIAIGEPEAVSSVTLEVGNPFTPGDNSDTTPITIKAPDGISISDAENTPVSGLPKNVKMPLGQFGFTLSGVEEGGTVQMEMTANKDFKQFSYFKKSLVTNKWVNIMEGVTINNDGTATVKFSLKDGGEFDADRTPNGVIVDPGGVGQNALLPMIAEETKEVGNVSLINELAATGTLSYAITGGEDRELFEIDPSTGLLAFKAANDAPDYENPTDAGDTDGNNTYAVQITITGSTNGTEVQNLIVTVLNVAEEGDNLNTAPVIIGLRAEAQAVTVGAATALDDIRLVDSDGNTLTVTLMPTNGTIGGLTDTDPDTPGIQLTGTASQINTALAAATFTASAAGAAGVSVKVVDGNLEAGTPITTTAYYAITASAATSGGGTSSTSPVTTTTTTSNGVTVTTTTTTTTTSDGRVLDVVSIAPVAGSTSGGTGGSGSTERAEIALYYGNSSASIPATTASLPTGVGLTATGARTPANNTEALANLIQLVKDTAGEAEAQKNNMTGGGEKFLAALDKQAEKGPLIVNSVKLSVAEGTTAAPDKPITIEGSADKVAGTNGRPVEAIVIDVRDLPKGTKLELKNVEFAVIVGDGVEVIGGKGQNIVYAGTGSQKIVLGEDDDELHGGDGDDVIGSEGGNDLLHGDEGNDTVFGGEGDDTLWGGAGNDDLSGDVGSDTASYSDAASAVKVSLAKSSWQKTGGAGKDRLKDIENLSGSDFNDKLKGSKFDNMLEGGTGNDSLSAGKGIDTASYASALSGVTVAIKGGWQETGGAGRDKLSGIENLTGSAFDDALTGDRGSNALTGGLGADTLSGGDGADRFCYEAANEGGDRIVDFVSGQDALVFVGSAFGGLAAGTLAAESFVGSAGAVASTAGQHFLFDTVTGRLYFDTDGNGAGEAVLIATLTGVSSLDAQDILIV